ncbi:Thiamine pyrophosphate enzyme N-terminal TPP-binding domain [Trinorchestia longiramus]|nr:Thiamine pyrophosphate enzyme N-terminal TPP-binding domain [Trinorchestia longiramus]
MSAAGFKPGPKTFERTSTSDPLKYICPHSLKFIHQSIHTDSRAATSQSLEVVRGDLSTSVGKQLLDLRSWKTFLPVSLQHKMEEYLPASVLLFASSAVMGLGIGTLMSKFNLPYIWAHKVNPASKRHGGEIVVDVLKKHNVKHIFTLSGGHISPILVAAEKEGIQVVDTRHEVTTVFAADAVARMSGSVGVAVVTAGPGLTNTVTAVKNAQMAESPVLLMGGAAATILQGRGALQDIEQLALFKPLCKYTASVKTVRDIAPTLREALKQAQSGTPGPVFVEFPIDVLYPYSMVSKEIAPPGPPPKNIQQRVVQWYLSNYLNNLYAGAWEPRNHDPLSLDIPIVPYATVEKCASLLRSARKPVFVVGSQATLPPSPAADTRRALEKMGVPCFLGGMARGLLGRKSAIQMRQKRGECLKEADVIVLAGSVADFRLSYGRVLNKHAKIIAVNRNKEQLYKNSDMFWKPEVAAEGDVGTFLKDLSSAVSGYQVDESWVTKLAARDQEKEEANAKMAEVPPEQHLNPLKLFMELEEALPEDAVLVADGGDFVGTASYILRPRGPLKWLDPGAFGTLGVGGGFAIGAKLSRPESQVWIIYGDGACGYSLSELDTYVRHNLPLIAVVGNDAGWTQIAREQVPIFGSSVACDLVHTDYHKVAEGFGARGLAMGRGDNMTEVFKKAQEIHDKEKKPVLINALIGKSKFREGSLSV